MKIAFAEAQLPSKGAVAAMVLSGGTLSASAKALDKASGGAVARAIGAGRFDGKTGQTLWVLAPAGLENVSILLLGIGRPKDLGTMAFRKAGAILVQAANAEGMVAIVMMMDPVAGGKLEPADRAAEMAYGARLAAYRFDRYLTEEPADKKPTLKRLSIHCKAAVSARRVYKKLEHVADGVDFTRNLVSEPGNVIYPETLADECKKLSKFGVDVEVLNEEIMASLGMGALLGVGQGSIRESQLVVMQWNGGSRSAQPLAFVGKGVTFDTGGISIKPSGGMQDMKWDMGGAGTVIGLMHALAARKAKAQVVGVVGLVENMPSGSAQRPGDIVKSMSGQTIEVLNTDAEGRLVLADTLWYTQDRFKPRFMVDLATLTGAIVVALGEVYGGLYANDDRLAKQLVAAGEAVDELLWRMPLAEAYDKKLDSPAADMANISGGRWGGSITAAQFLQRFTNKVPWAHLDIAGVAWSNKSKSPMAKGATAFGVQLLDKFVQDNYE